MSAAVGQETFRETERFLAGDQARRAAHGAAPIDWLEAGLREALLEDGRGMLEQPVHDPGLQVPEDAPGPEEKGPSKPTTSTASSTPPGNNATARPNRWPSPSNPPIPDLVTVLFGTGLRCCR